MNGMSIEALGFTKEEIERKVIDRIVEQVMRSYMVDEDGEEHPTSSKFQRKLEQAAKDSIDQAISAIAEKHISPNVEQYILGVTFQETNKWGEPKKEPLTFKEYLSAKAEKYFGEMVNHEGKSQDECRDGYSWRADCTRVTHLIKAHLDYTIKTTMADALKSANDKIVGGIKLAVEHKLKEVAEALKAKV